MVRTKNRYRTTIESEKQPISRTYSTGIYIRLSKERTEAWRNKSQSLETQESLAREFAKERGLIVTKCYIDYEYSGTKFNRPAYQEMMTDIKTGLINCILIRDLSRLGRNYIEMGRLIDKVFPFLGVRFISINDNLDTINGLEDKKSFEVEIKNLVNDLYSKDISKKVTASHIQQASQGFFIGSFAPYGYQLDKQERGIKLIIDPMVNPVLKRIFRKLQEGKSINEVTKYLNNEGVAVPMSYRQLGKLYRTVEDTREWKSANLLRLVQNPVYQGHLVQRKTNKTLSEKDYIRFENAHEAYISQKDAEAIMSLIHQRKNRRKSANLRTPNRYKSLIFGAGKSTQMPRYCKHFSSQKSEYDYYYFMDYIYSSDKSERQTVYISEQDIDKIILELVQSEMKRLGTVKKLLLNLKTKKEERLKNYQKQILNNQKILARLQAELSDLYLTYRLKHQERENYLSKKVEITSKIETISQEITQCESSMRLVKEEHQRQVTWVNNLANCQNQAVLTAELLSSLIGRIEINSDKSVTVTFTCQLGGDDHG